MIRPYSHALDMHGFATVEPAVRQLFATFDQVILADRTHIIFANFFRLDPVFLGSVWLVGRRGDIRKRGTLTAEVLVHYLVNFPLN